MAIKVGINGFGRIGRLVFQADLFPDERNPLVFAIRTGVRRQHVELDGRIGGAANQGNAAAQYNLGASYAMGAGVAKSDVDAAKWFRRAADQGMAFAQLNLGLLYAAGNGVPQDNVEAFKWLEIAFAGLPPGGPRMDVARAMTDVSANMTRDQLIEAKQRQRAWQAKPETK